MSIYNVVDAHVDELISKKDSLKKSLLNTFKIIAISGYASGNSSTFLAVQGCYL